MWWITLPSLNLKEDEEGAVTKTEGSPRDKWRRERDGEREREQELCGESSSTGAGTLGEGVQPDGGDMAGKEPGVVYFHFSFFPLPDLLALFPIVGIQLGNPIARGLLGPNKGTFSWDTKKGGE